MILYPSTPIMYKLIVMIDSSVNIALGVDLKHISDNDQLLTPVIIIIPLEQLVEESEEV